MKKCPFCAEEIQDAAIKCRHCGEMIGESKNSSDEKRLVSEIMNLINKCSEIIESNRFKETTEGSDGTLKGIGVYVRARYFGRTPEADKTEALINDKIFNFVDKYPDSPAIPIIESEMRIKVRITFSMTNLIKKSILQKNRMPPV